MVLLFIFEITLNEALTFPSLKMPQIVAIQLYFVVMCLVQWNIKVAKIEPVDQSSKLPRLLGGIFPYGFYYSWFNNSNIVL